MSRDEEISTFKDVDENKEEQSSEENNSKNNLN